MDYRLMGGGRWGRIAPSFEYDNAPPEQPAECGRNVTEELPAHERVENFEESVIGFRPNQAMEESCRCLRCDIKEHH
jgi:hypothetical protein